MSVPDARRRTFLKIGGVLVGGVLGSGILAVAASPDDERSDSEGSEDEREEYGEEKEDDDEQVKEYEDEREKEKEEDEEREEPENERGEEAEVKFRDQTVEDTGTPTVYVEEVKVPEGGWIVIHNWGTDGVTDDDTPAKNFVGVSTYLEPGEYENLPVELGGDRAVADPPSDGEIYTTSAMAHRDDPANRTYDFPNAVADGESPDDPPYTNDDGDIIQSFADVNFE